MRRLTITTTSAPMAPTPAMTQSTITTVSHAGVLYGGEVGGEVAGGDIGPPLGRPQDWYSFEPPPASLIAMPLQHVSTVHRYVVNPTADESEQSLEQGT
jgi:hypothetical protein